jgi:hypothetical protein
MKTIKKFKVISITQVIIVLQKETVPYNIIIGSEVYKKQSLPKVMIAFFITKIV